MYVLFWECLWILRTSKQAGLNSFTLTPKQWIEQTNAVGLISKQGRYGGTYAHKEYEIFKKDRDKSYISDFDRKVKILLEKIALAMSMTKITENASEKFTIELLEKQGYQYIYAPVITLISKNSEGKLP